MKDLKENMKKNNMKKLMLSAVLGMFCYCTNNATEEAAQQPTMEIKDINNVLETMLTNHVKINEAKKAIDGYTKKIYIAIKGEEEKITKNNVLVFITNQFKEEQNKDEFNDDIKRLKQYFHLEEINDDKEGCNEENITEIFWTVPDEKETIEEIKNEDSKDIKNYFNTIIDAEKAISDAFKKRYDAKKEANKDAQYNKILEEIKNECCGNEEEGDSVTRFIGNLRKIKFEGVNEEERASILTIIKRRITLSNNTEQEEQDFTNFLKQKIVEEKKKNIIETEDIINIGLDIKPKKKRVCPCCDCWEKKKTTEV